MIANIERRPTPRVLAPVDAQLYDFRRPHRVSKERLRTLEAMYGRMVQSLEGWLMGRVRGQLELKLQSVEQMSFGEYTLQLPAPCAAYIFDIQDTGGQQGVVYFGNELAFFMVDRLFGGSGAATVLNRALTPMERLAVRVVAERVMHLTSDIWSDHVELDLSLSGFESIPEILRAVNREDPVLVATIEALAAGEQSQLQICLPFAVLDKFFAAAQQRVGAANGSERELQFTRSYTEQSLRGTRVVLHARLPQFQLTLRDLVTLKVGQVIPTGVSRGADIQLVVGGQQRFRASAGRVQGNLAVKIIESTSSAPIETPDFTE